VYLNWATVATEHSFVQFVWLYRYTGLPREWWWQNEEHDDDNNHEAELLKYEMAWKEITTLYRAIAIFIPISRP